MLQCHVEFESCFLIDFARQNDLLWEVRCLENIVNTLVFNRFHVYQKIELWVSPDCFLESFRDLVPLGSLLVVFEGVEISSEIRRKIDTAGTLQDSENPPPGG